MKFDTSNLPTDPVLLQKMLRDLLDAFQQHSQQNEARIKQLEDQLTALQRMTYGRRSERIDPEQARLSFASPEPVPEPPAPATKQKPVRKGHGRSRPNGELSRERVEHAVAADELKCPCGSIREKIGEDVSERLDYRPACFFVRQHVRFKYACATCKDGVVAAPVPFEVIDKGLPGTGLLAHVAVSKYADHLPLARLEKIFKRHGANVSRSTMCGWVETTADLLEPVVRAARDRILQSMKIHTDDTPVPVLDRELDRTRMGRLWVYIGDPAHPYVVFDYTPNRKRDGPLRFLGEFTGYLQADAYAGYDALCAGDRVRAIACWAHVRRKFFDAQTSAKVTSSTALTFISALYDLEREARDKRLKRDERHALRAEKSSPILADFKKWLEHEAHVALPKSAIGQAIGYALNQWPDLVRYLEDGWLDIDNNAAEREIRPIAVGRKNWSFAGSDAGGHRAAVIYSVIASCRRHGIDPYVYIADVLERVSTHPANRVSELLPGRWAPPTKPEA